MRLNLGIKGDWLVDPSELAARFGIGTEHLKRLKLLHQVEAFIEPTDPSAPDETRVKVRMLSQVWRGIFDQSGELIREELF